MHNKREKKKIKNFPSTIVNSKEELIERLQMYSKYIFDISNNKKAMKNKSGCAGNVFQTLFGCPLYDSKKGPDLEMSSFDIEIKLSFQDSIHLCNTPNVNSAVRYIDLHRDGDDVVDVDGNFLYKVDSLVGCVDNKINNLLVADARGLTVRFYINNITVFEDLNVDNFLQLLEDGALKMDTDSNRLVIKNKRDLHLMYNKRKIICKPKKYNELTTISLQSNGTWVEYTKKYSGNINRQSDLIKVIERLKQDQQQIPLKQGNLILDLETIFEMFISGEITLDTWQWFSADRWPDEYKYDFVLDSLIGISSPEIIIRSLDDGQIKMGDGRSRITILLEFIESRGSFINGIALKTIDDFIEKRLYYFKDDYTINNIKELNKVVETLKDNDIKFLDANALKDHPTIGIDSLLKLEIAVTLCYGCGIHYENKMILKNSRNTNWSERMYAFSNYSIKYPEEASKLIDCENYRKLIDETPQIISSFDHKGKFMHRFRGKKVNEERAAVLHFLAISKKSVDENLSPEQISQFLKTDGKENELFDLIKYYHKMTKKQAIDFFNISTSWLKMSSHHYNHHRKAILKLKKLVDERKKTYDQRVEKTYTDKEDVKERKSYYKSKCEHFMKIYEEFTYEKGKELFVYLFAQSLIYHTKYIKNLTLEEFFGKVWESLIQHVSYADLSKIRYAGGSTQNRMEYTDPMVDSVLKSIKDEK